MSATTRLRTGTLLTLAIALASAPALGAGVRWQADEPLGEGQVGTLELVFDGAEPTGPVELPEIDGLRVVGPPSQSTQLQIVNGRRSDRFALGYPVRPERRGRIELPAFEVETTGGRLEVAAAELEVGRPLLGSPGGGAVAQDEAISAELRPGQDRPYAGEVFDVHALVASALPAEPQGAPEWRGAPVVAEGWREAGRSRTADREVLRFSTRAFASQPGRLELPPLREEVQVETGRMGRGLFSLLAPPEVARVTVATEPVALEIRPLPPGAPPGFAGAVGRFALESKLVPEHPRAGEPVTWTLRLRGTGNWPAGVALPAREIPASLRAIAPRAEREFEPGHLFSGAISEDLVLIPESAGRVELPPVEFSYFDPQRGRYETARVEPPPLEVAEAAPGAGHRTAAAAQPGAAAAPRAAGPAAPRVAEAAGPDRGDGPALPRDPLPGSGRALAPFASARVLAAAGVPLAALALYWLALASGHARRLDPRRPGREALRAAGEAVAAVARARDAAERRPHLLAWERSVSTLFGVDHRAPTAAWLRGAAPRAPGRAGLEAWLALLEQAEHALYSSGGELPGDWCERARRAVAGVRTPRWNPLRTLLPRHLLPAAGAAALVLALVGTSRAEPVSEYSDGRVAAAAEGFEARAAEAPTDWIARYNLGLAASQLGQHGRALGETLAAWLLAPRSDDAAWNLGVFAERLRGVDPRVAALTTSHALGLLARQAPPAAWQIALVAASALFSTGAALRLRWRFGRGSPRLARAGLPLAAAAALLAAAGAASLAAWGVFADPRASLLASDALLHSIPTDAETSQAKRPLPAGSVVRADRDFLGWTRVELETGESGWLRGGSLVRLYAKPPADLAPAVAGAGDGGRPEPGSAS